MDFMCPFAGARAFHSARASITRGPTLDSFLEKEGLKEELSAIVAKERIAFQLQQAMRKKAHHQGETRRTDGYEPNPDRPHSRPNVRQYHD